jgi:hypothetical protein
MPSTPNIRAARIAAAVFAGAVALLPLTGCTLTSNNVSCSTSSCTATLSGDGAEAEILGTTLSLGNVENGRASLSVAGASVSCAEGESVSAGSLQLECTSVTDESVELTASVN